MDNKGVHLQVLPGIANARRRRGIYLLPNLFTTCALFCGYYAVIAAMDQRYMHAALAILVATVMDMLDGRVARLTGTQSEFGHQYDSLTDLISFGVAPAVLLYQWSLHSLGKFGWVISFLYAATAALRLARYNVQTSTGSVLERRFFQGLASTAAGGMVAAYVWMMVDYGISGDMSVAVRLGTSLLTLAAAGLMVSNLRYHSLKGVDFRERIRLLTILSLLCGLLLISIEPATLLFVLFFGYLLAGPFYTLLQVRRRLHLRQLRRQRHAATGLRNASNQSQ